MKFQDYLDVAPIPLTFATFLIYITAFYFKYHIININAILVGLTISSIVFFASMTIDLMTKNN